METEDGKEIWLIVPGDPVGGGRKEVGAFRGMKVLIDSELHDEIRFVADGRVLQKISLWG